MILLGLYLNTVRYFMAFLLDLAEKAFAISLHQSGKSKCLEVPVMAIRQKLRNLIIQCLNRPMCKDSTFGVSSGCMIIPGPFQDMQENRFGILQFFTQPGHNHNPRSILPKKGPQSEIP